MSEHEVAQWLAIFKTQNKSMENPKDFISEYKTLEDAFEKELRLQYDAPKAKVLKNPL